MKGIAVLFGANQTVTIFEDVEKADLEEICKLEDEENHVSSILWHDEDIDWDYGY
jgi:hypothetical protein